MSRHYRYQLCDGTALTACPKCQADLTKSGIDRGIAVETDLSIFKAMLQNGEITGVDKNTDDLLDELAKGLLIRIACAACLIILDEEDGVTCVETKKKADKVVQPFVRRQQLVDLTIKVNGGTVGEDEPDESLAKDMEKWLTEVGVKIV